jgi:hypothetical protein
VACLELYRSARPGGPVRVGESDLGRFRGDPDVLREYVEGLAGFLVRGRRSDRAAVERLFARLYLRQPGGTLTTALVPAADLAREWTGKTPFEEVLRAARQLGLLRDGTCATAGGGRRCVSLGHDGLARVAADWDVACHCKPGPWKKVTLALLVSFVTFVAGLGAVTKWWLPDLDHVVHLRHPAIPGPGESTDAAAADKAARPGPPHQQSAGDLYLEFNPPGGATTAEEFAKLDPLLARDVDGKVVILNQDSEAVKNALAQLGKIGQHRWQVDDWSVIRVLAQRQGVENVPPDCFLVFSEATEQDLLNKMTQTLLSDEIEVPSLPHLSLPDFKIGSEAPRPYKARVLNKGYLIPGSHGAAWSQSGSSYKP